MTRIPEWLKTDHPREVIEAAYARSDLFERRRVLMDDWHVTWPEGRGRIQNRDSKEARGFCRNSSMTTVLCWRTGAVSVRSGPLAGPGAGQAHTEARR